MTEPASRSGDWFGSEPRRYARARPVYPQELFAWLASHSPGRGVAWDVATGSGQAAVPLARLFAHVHASDRFPGPLSAAPRVDNIRWALEPGERCSLPDTSADLVTVAAGLHWLDAARFSTEVERVLRPGGILAAWTYRPIPREGPLARLLEDYSEQVLGPYWSPALRDVQTGYAEIDLPGTPIPAPAFDAQSRHDFEGTCDMMRSWSAAEVYLRQRGEDPVDGARAWLVERWTREIGPLTTVVPLLWPMALRVQRL